LDDFDKSGEDKDATDKETIRVYPFRAQRSETDAKKPFFFCTGTTIFSQLVLFKKAVNE